MEKRLGKISDQGVKKPNMVIGGLPASGESVA